MIRCCDSTYWMSRTTLGKRRRLTRQESTPLAMLAPMLWRRLITLVSFHTWSLAIHHSSHPCVTLRLIL